MSSENPAPEGNSDSSATEDVQNSQATVQMTMALQTLLEQMVRPFLDSSTKSSFITPLTSY
jgi:hypothetical protein